MLANGVAWWQCCACGVNWFVAKLGVAWWRWAVVAWLRGVGRIAALIYKLVSIDSKREGYCPPYNLDK